MEYRMKAEVILKESLTEHEKKEANKLIDQMLAKWEIHKFDNTTYIAEKNNRDLGKIVLFAHHLNKQSKYFQRIFLENIESGSTKQYI